MAADKLEVEGFSKHCQLGSVFSNRGSVWSVSHKTTSKHFAAKIYQLDKFNEELINLQEELKLVRQLKHKNIVSYFSVLTHKEEVWILMTLYGYTSISRVVATHFNDGLCEKSLCLIVRDVLAALQYLHSRGIIHRGIRGSHILVNSNGNCVLSGFRHSICAITQGQWVRPTHEFPSEVSFNLNWASPELLRQDMDGYTEKTDIYSLGITMCELGNGEVPFSHLEPQLMLVEKNYGREPYLRDVNTCGIVDNGKDSGMGESYGDCLAMLHKNSEKCFSSFCHSFVSDCLAFQPRDRLSAERLLTHSFVRHSRKPSLPQLLHPVTPINDETDFGDVDPELLQRIDEISLCQESDDIEWDL